MAGSSRRRAVESAAMSALVTAQESDLLRIARAVVGQSSYAEVERLLSAQRAAPSEIGPTAMELLQKTLSRGVGLAVLRGGGWRQERSKRLWERTSLPPIDFQASSFQLLQWMLHTPLSESGLKALPGKTSNGWADEALLALALQMVTDTACERGFASQTRVRSSALCWVLQPAALARAEALGEGPVISLTDDAPLTFFLEALQPTLARAWARMEQGKGEATDPGELARVGRAQDAVLAALVKAADASKRRELLGFLVDAGAQVIHEKQKGDEWVKNLSPTTPLRERTDARKQAGAFLKALVRLRSWDQEHRAVRFFEEDYEKSQAMVKAWEVLGDKGFREAERLLSELENPV
jgi:hypothetical protein